MRNKRIKLLIASAAAVVGVALSAAVPAFASNQYYFSNSQGVATTQGPTAGDGYYHGKTCNGCGSDESDVGFYSANGNAQGTYTVTCNDTDGWWPFTVHRYDTENCGDATKRWGTWYPTFNTCNATDGNVCWWAYSTNGAQTVQASSSSGVSGTLWVEDVVGGDNHYINVYQSDADWSGSASHVQMLCGQGGGGAKLIVETYASNAGCNWSVTAWP